ncbi:MAG: hypothetical protein OER95_00620 [Acidimicrobiia bacterium]|nr:hypothetical protein [Acidimicrobiia bacterium]
MLTVHGVEVLKVSPPEDRGGPFQLSGRFFDSDESEVLRIVNNEIEVNSGSWDVEQVGQKITIRKQRGEITLSVAHVPPATFHVERLNMNYKYHHLEILRSGALSIEMTDSPIGPHQVGEFTGQHVEMSGPIGIHIPAKGGFRLGLGRSTDSEPLLYPGWSWEPAKP